MTTVGDYMNRHLVYLRGGDRIELARKPMLELGLTAVPILDEEHRPVGVVTLGDLSKPGARAKEGGYVHTVLATASVAEAARRLVADDVHHLVVVDAQGAAVGMLSSSDVVRALIGAPPKHPPSIERLIADEEPEDIQSEYRSE
jgi:CBS domain-containing protein